MLLHFVRNIILPNRIFSLFLLLTLWSTHKVKAQVVFEYTPTLRVCEQHLATLRLSEAGALLNEELKKNNTNAAAFYLKHYYWFFKLMVHQDPAQLPAFEKVHDDMMNRVKQLPETSPHKHFALGSMLLQSAFVKGAFNNYLGAAWDFRSSYQEVSLNEKKFPSFAGHKKELGALTALIGTFPSQYLWVVHAVGLHGDFGKGMQILKHYLNTAKSEPKLEMQQAGVMYTLIQLNFGKEKKDAWQYCESFTQDFRNNQMLCYLRAYVSAKCGENGIALQTLKHRPTDDAYEPIQYMNLMMGNCLLHELDYSAALWFKKYLAFSISKASAKEAYQKLSWISWLQADTLRFKVYHDLMMKASKETGSEAKLLNADMEKGYFLNPYLLKARLLFDGGYYASAIKQLQQADVKTFSAFQNLEYEYRYARIYHETGKTQEAIQKYKRCMETGKSVGSYMVPNACLLLAELYHKLQYKDLAIYYYEKVLQYDNFEYESSIHQKAKTALEELK